MNIGFVLSRINAGDYDFFNRMTDEEVKSLPPYVLALWLRGANQNRPVHTLLTEIHLNEKLFTLSKHPRLLYMLAVHANSGLDNTRYSFIPDKKEISTKRTNLIRFDLECSEEVAELYAGLLTEEDYKELEEQMKEGKK